jgi:hypothetical protein
MHGDEYGSAHGTCSLVRNDTTTTTAVSNGASSLKPGEQLGCFTIRAAKRGDETRRARPQLED